MSSTISSYQNQSSRTGILGKLTGLIFGGFTKKVIADVSKNLEAANDGDIGFLEKLNSYNDFSINNLDEFEEMIIQRKFLSDMLIRIHQEMTRSKSKMEEDDQLFNEFVHINNTVCTLIETNKKVHLKLDEIHNKILSSASENISSEVLDEIWKGEEELWDDFYLQSKKSS